MPKGTPTNFEVRVPLAVRLMRYIDVDSAGCWNWIGATNARDGYGRIQVERVTRYAHRVVYELLVGPIPAGLQLDHLCRNRPCCNPDHLEPVTARVNTLRSNSPAAMRARRTTCSKGHPLAGDNLYVWNRHRTCRTCKSEYAREWRARKAAS